MLYNGFASDLAKRFQRKFEEMKVVHNFEWGDEFEIALAEVLRELLPGRAGICRGYVVGRDGRLAGDDIIIFDAARFPTLRSLGASLATKEHVPAEAVLAYIEAKHTLNIEEESGQSLTKAIQQINAVKSISRPPVPLSQIGHGVSLGVGFSINNNLGFPRVRNPWYAAIFARNIKVDSSNPREELARKAQSISRSTTHMPDTIVAGNLIGLPALITRDTSGNIVPPARTMPCLCDSNELIFMDTPGIAIGTGVLHLLQAMEIITLGEIPWEEMIIESLNGNAAGEGTFSAGIEPIRGGVH